MTYDVGECVYVLCYVIFTDHMCLEYSTKKINNYIDIKINIWGSLSTYVQNSM